MTHDLSQPTHLLLNSRCEFFYSAGNVFASLGHCTTKELANSLDRFPSVDVKVEFRVSGSEDQQASDIKRYTKRLRSLPAYYSFSGFSPKVIDGHKQSTMVGTLRRLV